MFFVVRDNGLGANESRVPRKRPAQAAAKSALSARCFVIEA
jgi:hypothetical protein